MLVVEIDIEEEMADAAVDAMAVDATEMAGKVAARPVNFGPMDGEPEPI